MRQLSIIVMILLGSMMTTHGQALIQSTGSSNNFSVQIGANFGGNYQAGHTFCFIANHSITGPATLAINGMSPQNIVKHYNQTLSGEIIAGQSVCVIYDGTNFQMTSPTIPLPSSTTSTGWVTTTFGLNYDANGSVVVRGTINTGPVYDITQGGTATWFQYSPRKGALKIGRADATSWLDGNTGRYTFSSGDRNLSGGNNSAIIGGTLNSILPTTSGVNSVIIGGTGNIVSNNNSVHIGGTNSTISGFNAIGIGSGLLIPSYGEIGLGLFNIPYTANSSSSFDANDRLLVIGNGQSNAVRSNVLVISKNGNIGINNIDIPSATLDINGTVKLRNFTTPGVLGTDNTGQVQLISACGFNAYRTTNQTITSSIVGIVNFDALQYNDGNAFDLSTDEFTTPSNGVYQFSGKIMVDGIGQVDLMMHLNGSVIEQTSQFFPLGTPANNTLSINTTLKLNTGDKITLRVLQITVSDQIIKNINNATIRFSGSRLY